MYSIYSLEDLNGKVKYIGQTQNIDARKREQKKINPHILLK